MKKLVYGLVLLSAVALAEEASKTDAKGEIIVALEEASKAPIKSGMLLTTGSREKNLIDRENMKITLGPQSVAEFNGKGVFRLLRGSAYLEAPTERQFYTVNATVSFAGRLLVSFDHVEKSTSTFVLAGEARVQNPFEQDRTIVISRHQGSSLVTGEVYPNLVRGLDLAQVDEWLKGYHWNTGRRNVFLRDVPKADELRTLIAEKVQEMKAEESPEGRVGQKQNPLSDYFASIYEAPTAPEEHQEYQAVEPTKAKVAQKDPEVVLSPEHAAIIPLPETQIADSFTEVLSQEEALAERKEAPQEMLATRPVNRKIASLPKARAKPAVELTPEDAAILRLRGLQAQSTANTRAPRSRAPASIASPARTTTLVPDPVYDLSENF